MAKRDKLLDLVHTLTMSEKRYFKLFSQRQVSQGGTNYEQLFDLACSEAVRSSADLERTAQSAGLPVKYLAADKNYLYQLVLRALDSYHSGRNASMQVKEWLRQAEILYDKGLYEQCLTLMKKARQQAGKHHLYALLMEISLWERKALAKYDRISAIKASHEQVLDHLALMDNMHAFMLLYYRLLELQQQFPALSSEARVQALDAFIKHPFLERESVALSFQARLHYWRIIALYYRLRQQPQEEQQARETLLQTMKENEQFLEESPYEFVEVYSRMLNLKLYGGAEDFEAALALFRDFPRQRKQKRRNVEARVTLDAYLFELPWRIRRGQLTELPATLAAMNEAFAEYQRQATVQQRMERQYWEAAAWHTLGEPSKAIRGLNELNNAFEPADQLSLFVIHRLLTMMLHYEQENYPLLPYLAESSLRLTARKKEDFELEAWALRQLRRLARVEFRGPRYARLVLGNLLAQWNERLAAQPGSRLPEYLDLPGWARQHLPD